MPERVPCWPSVNLSADVLCERLNDEVVLLDLRSGTYFGLTAVAAQLWLLLEQGEPMAAARERLLEQFAVEAAALDADLWELLTTLEARGLIYVAKDEIAG